MAAALWSESTRTDGAGYPLQVVACSRRPNVQILLFAACCRVQALLDFCCMKAVALSLLALITIAHAAPPVISNIRVSQRPGTKLVDVYYDLADADGDLQLIQMAASSDGGLTYGLPCVTLSGHVGANVSPGTNRKITWNAGTDWNGNWVPQCRVRVTAHDGTTPPAPSGMAYIPSGPFQMGDNLDGLTDAMPVHNVQVDAFFIDKTEVTKELWQSVQTWGNANGYSIGGGSAKDVKYPVHSVTWYDAAKWCNARSQKEGITPCYYTDTAQTVIYKSGSMNLDNSMVKWIASGYRLPTEAEWEKAARGGTTGQRFPWGNTISHSNANYLATDDYPYDVSQLIWSFHPAFAVGGYPYTAPVGSFAPNAFGLYDVIGNAYEWCWDLYSSSYYGSPDSLNNPAGPVSASNRILRGGYWAHGANACRVSSRLSTGPSTSGDSTGFRAVRR